MLRSNQLHVLLLALVLGTAACTNAPSGPQTEADPSDEFESAGNAGTGRNESADAGASAASDSGAPTADDGSRTVEEADIYRFVGDRLYVLNQYRGLYVFDVSDRDHPVQIGRMPLVGYPVEMYIRGTRAYAIISDYFDYWRDDAALDAGLVPTFGSRIVAIDLSNPAAPHEIGDVVLHGYVSDTRLVGDVLYAVANRYSYWGYYGVPETESRDEMVLTSIDIADPTSIREVERLTFDGSGYYVHATSNAFVIASVRYDSPEGWSRTHIRYVDISSPTGHLAARGSVALDGYMQDDSALNVTDSQVRVLTRSWDDQTTKLRILDASLPDALPVLGELDYYYEGNVFGTTFDGDRLYMVHFQTIDPLEVVDLSDPTHPYVAGELEMPGWVDRIAALGDRLIGLGTDNSADGRAVTISLFDVSNPAAPALLDRVDSGSGAWAWSAATYERKAWTVDADAGVILFPYSSYGYDWASSHHALGIVEFDRDHLTVRGEVESPAPVERGAIRDDRVYAISQTALQVVNIEDRAHPTPTATLELARSVVDYARTSSVGVELVQPGLSWGWWGSEGLPYLRLSPLDSPDDDEEFSRLALPRAANALVVDGETALAIRTTSGCSYYSGAGCGSEAGPGVSIVSLADLEEPSVVADLDLPAETLMVPSWIPSSEYASAYSYIQTSYNAPYRSYQNGDRALDFGEGKFGFIRTTSIYCSGAVACDAVGIEPTVSTYTDTRWDESTGTYREVTAHYYYGSAYRNELLVVDSASRTVAAPVDLGLGVVENAFVQDGTLVYSHALPSRVDADGRSFVRYYMERFAIDASGVVTHLGSTNVPGVVIQLTDEGARAVTVDFSYRTEEPYYYYSYLTSLNVLTLDDDGAHRVGRTDIDGWTGGIVARGDSVIAAFSSGYGYYYGGSPAEGDDAEPEPASLRSFDVSHDENPSELSRYVLGRDSYFSVAATTNDSVVLSGGYGSGLAIFNVRDGEEISYRKYVRTQGYSVAIAQDGDTLYLSGGPYGIQTVSLAD